MPPISKKPMLISKSVLSNDFRLPASSKLLSKSSSCFIQPDGRIVKQLRQNRPGLMVNTVDLSRKFYDPMVDFRDMVLAGALGNGPRTIKDRRSRNTTIL